MSDLVDFLRARLDEDERTALAVPVAAGAVPPAHWGTGADPGGEHKWVLGTYEDINAHTPAGAEHVARHDPARVLREVEAKRRMLNDLDLPYPDEELLAKLLALPYADHPGYRQEWRP